MNKDDIRINLVTMNILDTMSGTCILSEETISHGSDFADFLKGHIYRLFSKDDVKKCEFKPGAKFEKDFKNYTSEDFGNISHNMGKWLYEIMEKNIDIPSADVFIVEFTVEQEKWIAILKANYKTLYGHVTDNNTVDIAIHKNLIPSGTAQLTEAAVINTSTGKIRVVEKKYDVNGVKVNYFSSMFLQCQDEMSDKAKVTIVNRAINNLIAKYHGDDVQKELEIKARLAERYEEEGEFVLSSMGDEIFGNDSPMKCEFEEKLDKYGILNSKITPLTDVAKKKLCTQEIITESGIKITIPLDSDEKNQNNIEFSALNGGTITIKNAGLMMSGK